MPKDLTEAQISFNFLSPARLDQRKNIKKLLNLLSHREQRAFESLTYIFCSDDYLLDINRKFLKHDFFTDIITFDMSDPGASVVIGEIYISVDRVRENALIHFVPFKVELLRVILHGALHLCGFKDKTAGESARMRAAEDKYLDLFEKMFHVKH